MDPPYSRHRDGLGSDFCEPIRVNDKEAGMDWKLLATTFGMVFLAELGDKTQLATFCLSADCNPKLPIFLGSAGALVTSSLIAVLLGDAVNRWIPALYIKLGAGAFFVIVGVYTLVSAVRNG